MRAPSDADRTYATFLHLGGLAWLVTAIPFAGVILPLILWLVRRDSSAWIDAQGRAAINFKLSMPLYAIAFGLLALALVGLTFGLALIVVLPAAAVAVIAYFVVDVVYCVRAALRASRGESPDYPLSIPFLFPPSRPEPAAWNPA